MKFKELFLWWMDFPEKDVQTKSTRAMLAQKLAIDKDTFLHNLSLTQEYCRLQMNSQISDPAQIFRSINPIVDGGPIFSFELEYEVVPGIQKYTHTNWGKDPLIQENDNLLKKLFEEQLSNKKHVVLSGNEISEGDILIVQFDGVISDGVSEAESQGVIDSYDLPPIDTWFYMKGNLLFAWIPKKFRHHSNEAILVNMLGVINWFEVEYPNEYKRLFN